MNKKGRGQVNRGVFYFNFQYIQIITPNQYIYANTSKYGKGILQFLSIQHVDQHLISISVSTISAMYRTAPRFDCQYLAKVAHRRDSDERAAHGGDSARIIPPFVAQPPIFATFAAVMKTFALVTANLIHVLSFAVAYSTSSGTFAALQWTVARDNWSS